MKRLHWGQGRVKVFAVRSEIEELLLEGQPIASIYAQLTAAGKIEIAKRTFERHASTLRFNLEKKLSKSEANNTTSSIHSSTLRKTLKGTGQ